jgi:hypothetical protein
MSKTRHANARQHTTRFSGPAFGGPLLVGTACALERIVNSKLAKSAFALEALAKIPELYV